MKLILCLRDGGAADAWLRELRAALPEAEVAEWRPGMAGDADIALVWAPPQQLFDEQPRLRAVFNLGAGVDPLLALRLPPALPVVRLHDAGMAVQMAEYVCHALIRFYREFDAYAAQQREARWQPRAPRRRADFPVGLMGLGALGGRVAEALRGFDFPLVGWSRTRRALDGVRCLAGDAELDDFLQATRVLVCLLPLTDATRGLLNRARLERLRPGGYLINLGRGALVVEQDLHALLRQGRLAGCALDVFTHEPLPPEHWAWTQPGVTLTPHIGAQTLRAEAVAQVAEGVRALRQGRAPRGLVVRERGY